MIRIDLRVDLAYQIDQYGADFIFNIHAANTACQMVAQEKLLLSQPITGRIDTDSSTGNRYMRLRAGPGTLQVSYAASITLNHHRVDPQHIAEIPIQFLPTEVLAYIYPSRYCQSDQFVQLATQTFGGLPMGYSRVVAIQKWVQEQVTFTPNTSNSNTSAIETLQHRVGVCRDFAHLMIAMCRAVNIPARFTTGTDFGADPVLGPPDFHAYVEVYLGHRWYIFDPSGTAIPSGMVRFGTGRDAADVAFATIFGGVTAQAPVISAIAEEDKALGIVLPVRDKDALSTDAGTMRGQR
jgi:transglutaminase-like putative cysteine protease